MSTEDGEQRLENVETQLAHLQKANDELSGELYRQQRQIDKLLKTIKELAGQLESIQVSMEPNRSLTDEKPPHY